MPRLIERKARLNVRLDVETRTKVEDLARRDGRTLSQTTRTLLRAGLAQRRQADEAAATASIIGDEFVSAEPSSRPMREKNR